MGSCFFFRAGRGGLVTRYGPRRPLIIGPLLAAAGFLLFAVPSVGGSYWTTFFPALVTLGLGMAVSVAPLTTVVMGAVDASHSGTASGINNAVARVAGLLSVAVLGAALLGVFSLRLNRSLTDLRVPLETMVHLQSGEIKLAAMEVPNELDGPMAAAVESSIRRAFVFGFRFIMLICAGLAVISAVFAWQMIGKGSPG